MQPPYQYPKTTKYPSSLEPTQAAYSSNYETTEQVHLNPYLNNPYELPSLPPPPPPQSRKGLIMVVIALLCLIIVSTSLFVGYVFIRPELARQTKVTATPMETPSPIPVPYTAHDIIHAFMKAHLPVYASSTKPDFPIQAPYQTDDIVFFQTDDFGYDEWYLAVFPDDGQAKADADYVNSDPHPFFVSYSKHRCLLLSDQGLDKEAAHYWDVMNTACK